MFVLNVKLANRVDIIDLIFLEKDNEMLTVVFCLDFMVLVSVNYGNYHALTMKTALIFYLPDKLIKTSFITYNHIVRRGNI